MIIPLDEGYRLKSDSRQWIIQKYTPAKEKKSEWKSLAYFVDPSKAVTELIQRRIRVSDAQTLAEALVEVDRVTRAVLDALAPHFKVEEVSK